MAGRRKTAFGLFLVAAALFTIVALYSWDSRDWGEFMSARNMCGPAGALLAGIVRGSAGPAISWIFPALLLYWGWVSITGLRFKNDVRRLVCLGILSWIFAAVFSATWSEEAGGWLGIRTMEFLELLAGRVGSVIIIIASLVVTMTLIFFGSVRNLSTAMAGMSLPAFLRRSPEKGGRKKRAAAVAAKDVGEDAAAIEEPLERDEPRQIDIREPQVNIPVPRPRTAPRQPKPAGATTTPADNAPLPDLSLLDDYDASAISFSKEELITRSEVIESKLEDYGLSGKVQKVLPGPVVTTFEFVPAPGVKVSQIANRSDDISLALAARALRIQAPIPGKGAIGIEVPNPEPKLVVLKEMMEHFPQAGPGLTVSLGKSVTGEPVFVDIAEMPHLLIAGATGSGKSVCINSIICSLLFNHTPATCRFILIDPKRLELITYNNIPHLLHPVITEARQALKVLNWMTMEMDRRYKLLAQFNVKNIKSYNIKAGTEKLVNSETGETASCLPYYVCVIDELADIMVTLGNEIYPPITRLAQMARAVGIHLVFATQRPSVDVITGLIKANFPCRIAFQVTSKTDSRTILDVNGAEALLGNGDMLYLPKNLPSPVRIQDAYISEREAENVADYWRSFQGESVDMDLGGNVSQDADDNADIDDDLFEQARQLVIMHQQGSISLIQRRLKVGYARAARLIDMLEHAGVVGPFEGSKAREVLVRREEYEGS